MGTRARSTGIGGSHLGTHAVPKSKKTGGGADDASDDCFASVICSARRNRVDIALTAGCLLDDGRYLLCGAALANSGAVHDGVVTTGFSGGGMAIGHWGLLVEAESVPENVQMHIVVMVVSHKYITR